MVYLRPHWLLNLSGPHFGVERWSMGVRLSPNFGPNGQAEQQVLCEAYAVAVSNWFTTSQAIGAQSKLDTVKLNLIDVNGRYANPWTNLVEYETPVGSGTNTSFPPQISLVAGLLTANSRGLASRGRIYLPSPLVAMAATTGSLASTQTTALAGKVKDLVDALNNVAAGNRVVIASNVGGGAENEVTTVEVGSTLDTMRSRRTSIEEERVQAAVATAPA